MLKHAKKDAIPIWYIEQKSMEYQMKLERALFKNEISDDYMNALTNKVFALKDLISDWKIDVEGGSNG